MLTVMLTGAAFAKGKADARAAFKRATQHFNLGEYQDALEQFKEAYRNFEDPTFLFNIAQCNRMLGNKTEALRGYKTFLREMPDTPNRGEVESLITSLERAIREDQNATTRPPSGTIVPRDSGSTSSGGADATAGAPPSVPPPSDSAATTTTATTQPALVAGAPPPAPAKKPVYTRWWLWTAVGVVAVGVGVGLGVGLSSRSVSYPSGTTTAGTVRF